jgi:hypothetical protein
MRRFGRARSLVAPNATDGLPVRAQPFMRWLLGSFGGKRELINDDRMKTVKTAALTAVVMIVGILLAFAIFFWRPIFLIYSMIREVPVKEKALLYKTEHEQLAVALRRFAAEQRWNNPEKENSQQRDFFYGDDQNLPAAVRALKPSWVEITDDRVDVGCGLAIWDVSRSFGISVWRSGLPGWGTKKLAEGMWFYSDDNRVPSRLSFPW